MNRPVAIIHLDESCLGNGRVGATPGGAGALIEVRTAQGLQRRDVYLNAPDTTNNRMALRGAIAVLDVLSNKGRRLAGLMVSDSQYLVKGITEWAPGWKRRGWRRKGGEIENLELWQELDLAAGRHDFQWIWVRGHARHAKNEYADHLAQRAARRQETSDGAVDSGFPVWLVEQRADGHYVDYDPDAEYAAQEREILGGRRFQRAAGA